MEEDPVVKRAFQQRDEAIGGILYETEPRFAYDRRYNTVVVATLGLAMVAGWVGYEIGQSSSPAKQPSSPAAIEPQLPPGLQGPIVPSDR